VLALPIAPSVAWQETFIECTRVLRTYSRPTPEDGFGQSLASVPDVDGDGVDELLVGSPGPLQSQRPGRIQLFHGASGVELFHVDGIGGDRLGGSVSPAGDLDGDGVGDLLVGAPGVGRARVFSGSNGLRLLDLRGRAGAFGHSVAGMGDIDLDGVPDLAVVELDPPDPVRTSRGRVSIVSGADGHELRSLAGIDQDDRFGTEIVNLGDVNGDGRSELAVLAAPGSASGRASVIDLASGTELFTHTGDWIGGVLGHLAVLGNVSTHPRVRTPGLLISSNGQAQVVDGASGRVVRTIAAGFREFFVNCAGFEDVDGDRLADFAISGFGLDSGRGWVNIFSTGSGALLRRVEHASGESLQDILATEDLDGDRMGELVTSVNVAGGSEVILVSSAVPVQAFGFATPGRGGIQPQISIGGCPRIGGSMRIEIERVVGGAPGLLVLGRTRADRRFRGGILYPGTGIADVPHVAAGARGVVGAGDASIPLALPSDVGLLGASFFAQALYLDRGAAEGVSFTRALRLTLY
jgi:hypothetical protein